MSFNHVEIARAASELQDFINTYHPAVRDVSLVEFSLPFPLADLNIGILLEARASSAEKSGGHRWLILSLRSPWLGVFMAATREVTPVKKSNQLWHRSFGGAVALNELQHSLTGQLLTAAESVLGDRVFKLKFSHTESFTFELFSSRPNWHLSDPNLGLRSWRPSAARSGAAPLRPFSDRFGAAESGQWFEVAFAHYLKLRQTTLLEHLQKLEERRLHHELKRSLEVVANLRESLKKSERAPDYRMWGELLKGVLHEYPRDFHAPLIDVHGTAIKLDPELSLSENLTKFFTRSKKLIRTQQEVKPRLELAVQEMQAARSALQRIQNLKFEPSFEQSFEQLKALIPELGKPPVPDAVDLRRKKEQKRFDEAGLKSFESREKFKIWVGRNHSQNEELVMRLARGNDLWFHLKGRPGAHVIVQLPGGKSASLETLLDAATLVAHYSGVKEGDKVEVDYTFRKYVKRVSNKSKGSGDQFLVTYSQNKSLMVKIEDARLERLLSQD